MKNHLLKEFLDLTSVSYEKKNNSTKARVGVYVSNDLNYTRRSDLEGSNSNILIIDIMVGRPIRIIVRSEYITK